MEDIFCYNKITHPQSNQVNSNHTSKKIELDEDDLYGILGCHPESSVIFFFFLFQQI